MQTIDVRFNACGGVRLAEKPLHLGHFAGTFAAAKAAQETRPLLYIIKDTEPFFWNKKQEKEYWIAELARMSTAISPVPVVAVVASELLAESFRLDLAISEIVTHNALVSAHFRKESIRAGTYKGSVRNARYPIDEATILAFLLADRFYSNADNERIVRFVRDVERRLVRKFGLTTLNLCDLRTFPNLDFLVGVDYRRMTTAGGNALSVLATDAEIDAYAKRACSLRSYFEIHPEILSEYRSGSVGAPGDDFLPFVLLRVFGVSGEIGKFDSVFSNHNIREELSQLLAEAMRARMGEWRQSYQQFTLAGSLSAEEVVGQSKVIAKQYGEWWYKTLDGAVAGGGC